MRRLPILSFVLLLTLVFTAPVCEALSTRWDIANGGFTDGAFLGGDFDFYLGTQTISVFHAQAQGFPQLPLNPFPEVNFDSNTDVVLSNSPTEFSIVSNRSGTLYELDLFFGGGGIPPTFGEGPLFLPLTGAEFVVNGTASRNLADQNFVSETAFTPEPPSDVLLVIGLAVVCLISWRISAR
jgi:hypothetical protein